MCKKRHVVLTWQWFSWSNPHTQFLHRMGSGQSNVQDNYIINHLLKWGQTVKHFMSSVCCVTVTLPWSNSFWNCSIESTATMLLFRSSEALTNTHQTQLTSYLACHWHYVSILYLPLFCIFSFKAQAFMICVHHLQHNDAPRWMGQRMTLNLQ